MTERDFKELATTRARKTSAKASSGAWRVRGPVGEVTTRYAEPRVTNPPIAQRIYGF